MKALFLSCLFLLAFLSTQASHIVGGEFELIWISGQNYRLNLIYYFDVEHNENRKPEIDEPQIQVSIFEKLRNVRMRNVVLKFISRTRVEYSQLFCASSELVTDKLVYTAIITLTEEFNSSAGYYVAWERCCRNYDIDNIYSEDPVKSSRFAGQTFYLEFPAVVKNNQPFINSSPRQFPALGDFACPDVPYYIDFAGIDDDGDSLSYSLITPLNTFSFNPVPNQNNQNPLGLTNPGPYPPVQWRPEFGIDNIMKESSDFQISTKGFLTVTPRLPGLFVFAIKCEEFREGVKIGTVIRDFQMLVVERGGCPVPESPSIEARKLGTTSYTNADLSVTFDNNLVNDQRCIELSITDPSSVRMDENRSETINLTLVPLNFDRSLLSTISLSSTSATIRNGAAATFQICFPKCPFSDNTPIKLGIIVSDDACPLSLTDTLIITANVQPPDNFTLNHDPLLTNSLISFSDTLRLIQKIHGGPIVLNVTGSDFDTEDKIVLRGNGIGFNAAEYGVVFQKKSGYGLLESQFTWPVNCQFDLREKDSFEFLFTVVDSTNACALYRADSLILTVRIEPPDNEAPELSVRSETEVQPIEGDSLTAIVGTPIHLTFTGLDNDRQPNDKLVLALLEQSGTVAPQGFLFDSDTTTSPLQASFRWTPDCSIFENHVYENSYDFKFTLYDDRCYNEKADTVTLHITIKDVDGSDDDFVPPNVFTPNGDDKNPFFAMVKEDRITGELIDILPKDNCTGEFRNVKIYSRWGRLVYESARRDFRWDGKDMPAGVYFYLITYSNRLYKGTVSIQL